MADRNLVLQLLITAKDTASSVINQVVAGVKGIGTGVSAALEPLRTFGTLLATAVGLGGGKELLDRADAYARLTNSLKIATSSEQEYQAALKDVGAIAGRTNADIETTAQLYGKVAQSAKELGLSQTQVGQLTEVISKGMQLSGASAETASGAILQLTQAFGSGALRGEEFNSVMEASPELMRQLAAGLGVTIGELRGLAEQGALTSRAVSAALLAQKDAIDQAYGETTKTVDQAFTNLNNQLILYIGKLNESTGVTATIGATLKLLADNLNVVAAAAGAGLVAALGKSTQSLISYVRESIAARAAARDHAIAAAAQREAALQSAQANLAAAQGAVNRAVAEQRAALALQESIQKTFGLVAGEQALSAARARSSAAAQAATAATVRYAEANAALNTAQTAMTAGTGLLSRAMGFLAGPGGMILLAVSAFASLLPLLSKNKTDLDALTVSTDQYRDSLKGLNNAQLSAAVAKLNEGIQEQEGVVRDAEAQVNKLREGHRNLFEVMSDGRPVAVQLTEAEGKLADERQKLAAIQDNLRVTTEALGVARRQEDADLGKQYVQYQQIQLAMGKYANDLDALGKQQKSVATANQERIQAEIDLAKATGDVQAVDRLTLELATARATAAQQQAELDRAAAVAANLKLNAAQQEYEMILQKQPKDEENLRIAKQDAELKNAQAAASSALAIRLQQQVKDTDALAQQTQVLETRLASLRAETEREVTLAERRTTTQQTQIQGAIDLAKAKGDEAAAARLTAEATQEEIDSAEERITQLGRQQAEIDQHIQKLYAQYNADNDYTDSERAVIEALKDKSAALGDDIAKIEAHLPLQEREAEHAKTMAGPIGELARLYAANTKEHERAAAAADSYYNAQVKEVEGAIRVAKAKGDEAQAAELLEKKNRILIDQAYALAQAKAQEVADAKNAVSVKTMELAADGQLTQAELDQIAALENLVTVKQNAAAEAQANASAMEAEAKAAKEVATAAKESKDNIDLANESFKQTGKELDNVNASYAKFRDISAVAFGIEGITEYEAIIKDIQSSIDAANTAADNLSKYGMAAATAETEDLATALENSESYLNDAADAAGQNLRQALADAKAEAESLREELSGIATDYSEKILELTGDELTQIYVDRAQALAEAEEKYAAAGTLATQAYTDAKNAIEAYYNVKIAKQKQADAEDSINKSTNQMQQLAAATEAATASAERLAQTNLSGLINQTAQLTTSTEKLWQLF